jgi:hypothetical protein
MLDINQMEYCNVSLSIDHVDSLFGISHMLTVQCVPLTYDCLYVPPLSRIGCKRSWQQFEPPSAAAYSIFSESRSTLPCTSRIV